MSLIEALASGDLLVAAELRPPRAELAASDGMDAWIDTYHAVRRLTRHGVFVCLTDSAVGAAEEDTLRHLLVNLGTDAPRDRIVPFLTSKHPLGYCLRYAEHARQHGFPALVVLGGDRHVGPPRCVEHAFELRQQIRQRDADLRLGGWANPHADAESQVAHLLDGRFTAEFYLTQVVSHHSVAAVERFVAEAARRSVAVPGMFGVFYYRSANPRTLEMLRSFLPVPVDALADEFARGARPEEVCARTIKAMMGVGVRRFYISNLPLAHADHTLARILDLAGV